MLDQFTWNVYLERADDDKPRKFIGTIVAIGEGQALTLAAQYYEVPSHDLVVKRKDLDGEQQS